ncbi:MAG: DEAD/DEAH box helicase, partial [Acidimicrobiia bacterium]|nr:DEAD/DEAH box helicase [Acidimicrobiia bacterium]
MGLEELVAGWANDPDLDGELVHLERLTAHGAIFGDLDPPLPAELKESLSDLGIDRLYRHQAKAISDIRQGKNTVVVAGTSSGKTLCYTIPIAERILAQPKS